MDYRYPRIVELYQLFWSRSYRGSTQGDSHDISISFLNFLRYCPQSSKFDITTRSLRFLDSFVWLLKVNHKAPAAGSVANVILCRLLDLWLYQLHIIYFVFFSFLPAKNSPSSMIYSKGECYNFEEVQVQSRLHIICKIQAKYSKFTLRQYCH